MKNKSGIARKRLREEFELAGEEEAFQDYAYVTEVIAINYSLMADELPGLGNFQKGLALDLGTGLGNLAVEAGKRYPQLQVIGIDISEQAVKEAGKKAASAQLINVAFQLGDVHKLAFADASVDLVISHGVIHHLRDISAFFLQIYRILKPGALAYLVDLRRDAPDELVKEIAASLPPSQAKAFTNSIAASYIPDELKEILGKVGITNFEVSGQKFSREAIFKNMDKLRKLTTRSANYTNLSQVIIIRK